MSKARLLLLVSVAALGLTLVSVAAAHGIVRIKGTNQSETLTGTAGRDVILARGGDDTINAGDGNDRAHGQRGNDTVNGEGGNDRLWGGHGKDNSFGGDGNDILHALARDRMVDTLDCGPGNDTAWLNARESDVTLNCEVIKTVSTTKADDDG
jgi:Ca2+-binding RTX toxin-like protein